MTQPLAGPETPASAGAVAVVSEVKKSVGAYNEAGVFVIDEGRVLESPPQAGVRLPVLLVVQPTSANRTNDNEGSFYYTDNVEEFFNTVDIVPVRVQFVRTKWPAGGFSRDAKPECWSADGAVAGDGALYAGRACRACPLAGVGREAHGCDNSHIVACVDVEQGKLMEVRVGTARWLADTLSHDNYYRRTVVELSTKKVTNKKGSWHGFRIGKARPVGVDDKVIVEQAVRDAMTALLYAPIPTDSGEEAATPTTQSLAQAPGAAKPAAPAADPSPWTKSTHRPSDYAPMKVAKKGVIANTTERYAANGDLVFYVTLTTDKGSGTCLFTGKAPPRGGEIFVKDSYIMVDNDGNKLLRVLDWESPRVNAPQHLDPNDLPF